MTDGQTEACELNPPGGAMAKQPGGDHYKKHAIQPIEYIQANGLGYCEGNVVKYVTRWRDKGGILDLRKAIHYLELLIDSEERPTAHARVGRLDFRAEGALL